MPVLHRRGGGYGDGGQSFNFRGRQRAGPFYDLIANIAAEEFGHIELVAATINTMLTGASPADDGKAPTASLAGVKGARMSQHYLLGGQGALPFAGADRLPARARRRSPGRVRARAGAPHGSRPHEAVPVAEHPYGEDPGVQASHRAEAAPQALSLLAERLPGARRGVNGPHPETGEPLTVEEQMPEGFPPMDLPAQPAVFAPDYSPEDVAEVATRLREAAGMGKEPTGVVANDPRGIAGKMKEKLS